MINLDHNSGIYTIKNSINNNIYVGSSCNLKDRIYRHLLHLKQKRHHSIHLQRAYDKYGKDNFRIQVVEYCKEALLKEREEFYMKKFNSCHRGFGYNITIDAIRPKMSEETKKKLSKTNMGHFVSKATRLKMSVATKGKIISEENKEKLRKYWRDGGVSKETLEKMRYGRTGQKNSKAHNDLLRKLNTGSKRSANTKRLLREAWVRRKRRAALRK